MRYQLTHSFIRVSGPTRNTALSDRNPATYNTVCSLHVALPAPHSTVCSAPFRASCYLTKAYARRAIFRLQAGASVSVTTTFHLPLCMTTPYANLPITDSSGRKYADRGITLPQLLPGAFKEVYRRRAVPACIVLPHSLLCSFFHISVFHSNLRQAGDLQTEGCRHLSVIPIFTYFTELQHYTRISRLQTHQGENVETSRCSKLSAEKCK